MNVENYMEELNKIKKEISSKEIKISKIKGRSDSLQEEIADSREELEDLGYEFTSLEEIASELADKGEKIESLIVNYKEVLSVD